MTAVITAQLTSDLWQASSSTPSHHQERGTNWWITCQCPEAELGRVVNASWTTRAYRAHRCLWISAQQAALCPVQQDFSLPPDAPRQQTLRTDLRDRKLRAVSLTHLERQPATPERERKALYWGRLWHGTQTG